MRMKLENWSVIVGGPNPYLAPELAQFSLQGKVYNDERHENGKGIITSSIVGKRNGAVVTKSGSEYELGEVDPHYESAYPGAKERVFRNLKSI